MQSPERPPVVIPESQPIESLQLPPGTTHWGTDLKKLAQTEKNMVVAANKTPDIVQAALSPSVLAFGGREFHSFSIQTYLNLVALKSPFVDRAEGVEFQPAVTDIVRALWAMVTPDEDARRIIARGGELLEDTVAAFASKISMADLVDGAATVGTSVASGFAPAAKMNPPAQEGGGTPLDATSSATAPAGS
jgi:hypothetical protein